VLSRDGCDDDNAFCCPAGKRAIDYFKMSGKCQLCREVYHNNKLENQIEVDKMAGGSINTMYQGVGKTFADSTEHKSKIDSPKRAIDEVDNSVPNIQQQLDLTEDTNGQLEYLKQTGKLKFERQKDSDRLQYPTASVASLDKLARSLLMPPPTLKDQPIEGLVEFALHK
jgi:hypothetical protein